MKLQQILETLKSEDINDKFNKILVKIKKLGGNWKLGRKDMGKKKAGLHRWHLYLPDKASVESIMDDVAEMEYIFPSGAHKVENENNAELYGDDSAKGMKGMYHLNIMKAPFDFEKSVKYHGTIAPENDEYQIRTISEKEPNQLKHWSDIYRKKSVSLSDVQGRRE